MTDVYRLARSRLARSRDSLMERLRTDIAGSVIPPGFPLTSEILQSSYKVRRPRANEYIEALIYDGFAELTPSISTRDLIQQYVPKTHTVAAIETLCAVRSSRTVGEEYRTDLLAIAQIAGKYARQKKAVETALTLSAFGLRLVAGTASDALLQEYSDLNKPALAYAWATITSEESLAEVAEQLAAAASAIDRNNGEEGAAILAALRYGNSRPIDNSNRESAKIVSLY